MSRHCFTDGILDLLSVGCLSVVRQTDVDRDHALLPYPWENAGFEQRRLADAGSAVQYNGGVIVDNLGQCLNLTVTTIEPLPLGIGVES